MSCTVCGLYEKSSRVSVIKYTAYYFLFVNMMPTEGETVLGSPSINSYDGIFKELIAAAGIDQKRCGFTYGIQCHTPSISKEHQLACFYNLVDYIQSFPPVCIVWCGADVKRFYANKFKEYHSTWITNPVALCIGGGKQSPLFLENVNRLQAAKGLLEL